MENVIRAKYVRIDGVLYQLIDGEVPDWAKEDAPDATLLQEGKAADAKKTGQEIQKLKDRPHFFYDENGYLTFNDGQEEEQ